MTRADIEHAARLIKAARHTCTDRDWCCTTGPTGCGTSDAKLAELRLAWRSAR